MTFVRRLLSRSAIVFAARLAGAAIMFATQAVLARRLGGDRLGQYTQATAAINILAALMPLGFQVIAAYFAVEYAARGQGRLLRCFLTQSYLQVGAMAALFFIAGGVALPLAAGDAPIAVYWPHICLMALAAALVFVSSGALLATGRPILAFAGDGLLRPAAAASALALALVFRPAADALGAMLWIMATSYFAVALAYVLLSAAAAARTPNAGDAAHSESRRWWRFALPWTLIALATDYFFDLDAIILSNFLSYSDLAVFGAVSRIFLLASYGVAAVYGLSLPDVVKAGVDKDRAAFQAGVARANLIAAALALAFSLGLAATGPWILLLFGPEFQTGAAPLAALCLSLLPRVAFGPAALALSLHDRPYAALPAVGLGLTGLVLGNLALVPLWGLLGASLAVVAAVSLWSFAMWRTALRITGVDVSIFPPLLNFLSRARAT